MRERSASRTLRTGARIAVRLVRCPDPTIIAGAVFPFHSDDAAIFEEIARALRATRIADAKSAAGWRADVLDTDALARAAADPAAIDPLVTAFWLDGAVQGVLDAQGRRAARARQHRRRPADPFVSLHYDLPSGVTSADPSDAFAARPGLNASDDRHWTLQRPGRRNPHRSRLLEAVGNTLVVEANAVDP